MILKNSLIFISLLFGVILTTVIGYPEHKVNTSDIQSENDEIYKPIQSQQQIEANERKLESLNNMDTNIDAKTEATLSNTHNNNISNNQLSNEYISIENEDKHIIHVADDIEDYSSTSIQTTENNIGAISKDEEYETEIPLNQKHRIGKLFTTTSTTIPQYIRRIDEEKTILENNKGVSSSTFDYFEDGIIDHMLKKLTTKIPLNKNLDNSSEENEEIVPLAMKYYDEISPPNASLARQTEKVSSEDYYDDEYNEPESPTTTKTTTNQTNNNSILSKLSPAFPTSTTTIKTTRAAPTPTPTPLSNTLVTNVPIIGQFESTFITTLAPSPQTPQKQTQTMFGITTTRTTTSRIVSAAAAASVVSDKKGKQIPIVSTVPIVTSTTTTSSRRRLLPHEQLRNYIEDAYIRMPLAVIVDPSAQSLEYTKKLWNDAMRTNLNIKIVLVTLNKSEEEQPAAFNFNNTRQFLAGLNSIKEQNSSDAFRGISHAAELVPYDSAVFISTAELAKHTDQVQDSAITLLKKRIRLYLIWFGERSLSENETQDSVGGILGEVAIRSGGEILHIVSGENSQELEGSTLTIVADAFRGSQEIEVPVDTTLSSLHVKIDKLMRRAVLETPNGG